MSIHHHWWKAENLPNNYNLHVLDQALQSRPAPLLGRIHNPSMSDIV